MRRRLIGLGIVLMLSLSGCSLSDLDQATLNEPLEQRSCAEVPGACVTEDALIVIVTYLTLFAELCGALVIGVAVIRAVAAFVPHIFLRDRNEGLYKENIRLQLGKSLALGLEFELGADILKTAVAPTLPIIAQLAAIIVLRTLLNYFLDRELREVESRHAEQRNQEQPRESRA